MQRRPHFIRLLLGLAILAFGFACTDHSNEESDAISVDVTSDSSRDANTDSSPDSTDEDTTVSDVSVDSSPDAQVDVAMDVAMDIPGDQGCVIPQPVEHRPTTAACDNMRSDFLPEIPDDGDPNYIQCRSHEECTDGTNGRCSGNSHDGYYCTYDQCFGDDDCGGSVCECGGGFRSDHNVCMAGNCSTDADCGPGNYCSPSFGSCGEYTGTVGYWCRTCEDECINDADCGDQDGFGSGYCMYSEQVGHWTCSYQHCAG